MFCLLLTCCLNWGHCQVAAAPADTTHQLVRLASVPRPTPAATDASATQPDSIAALNAAIARRRNARARYRAQRICGRYLWGAPLAK